MKRIDPSNLMRDPNMDYRIIATAEDAILAKSATAEAKYYRDPFAAVFAHAASLAQQTPRRQFQPIIKRGTHARVCCMDRAITAFLKMHASKKAGCEIVVLGAGKDTSYFRFCTKSMMGMEEYIKDPKLSLPKVHWYEVDHPSVIQEKAKIIKGSGMLSQCCPGMEATPTGFSSSQYHLVGADLRESPQDIMNRLNLSSKRPTLFLLECVFMYMPEDSTSDLLSSLASSKPNNAWIALYEPILGDDAFGNMMEQNLVKAKVAGPDSCLLRSRTLACQLQKLVKAGFGEHAVGCDLWAAYETVVTAEQRQLANRAEFLDEVEEWMLIMRHYCFIVATNSPNDQLTCVGGNSMLGFVPGRCQTMAAQFPSSTSIKKD